MTCLAYQFARLCRCAVAAAVVMFAPLAPADVPSARENFERGVRLLEDSQFAAAAAALERSLKVRATPSVMYNLALAYRGTGRYLSAIRLFERFLERAVGPRYEEDRKRVRAELDELRAELATLKLTVVGRPDEVRVDGKQVSRRGISRRLAIDPGAHVILVKKKGYRTIERRVNASAGSRLSIRIDAAAKPLPAKLIVRSSPRTAAILLDGKRVGVGQYQAALKPRNYWLGISSDGYEANRRRLSLSPGATERVTITLERTPSPSVFTRWWFWSGVAVVAAATTVTILLLQPDDEEPHQGSLGVVVPALALF